MTTIEIKHRSTGAVLWIGEAESTLHALQKAVAARADLAGAYLAGAYLAGADLADAYLAGADLAGAYLAGADLAGADLAGANLARADLADADLAGANLADANLARAYLAGANLAGADLADADLAGAKNYDPAAPIESKAPFVRKAGREARLDHAKRYREHHPEVPIVANLDAQILDIVTSGKGVLDMGGWHGCETTHCRAGWAVHLAGEKGYALEKELGGAEYAGRAIYRASTGRSPYFFATNERALEDIERCATEDSAEVQS